MRRSDTYLMDRLDEFEALIESGGMANMTEEEQDKLRWEIRDVVAELLDLEGNRAAE